LDSLREVKESVWDKVNKISDTEESEEDKLDSLREVKESVWDKVNKISDTEESDDDKDVGVKFKETSSINPSSNLTNF